MSMPSQLQELIAIYSLYTVDRTRVMLLGQSGIQSGKPFLHRLRYSDQSRVNLEQTRVSIDCNFLRVSKSEVIEESDRLFISENLSGKVINDGGVPDVAFA